MSNGSSISNGSYELVVDGAHIPLRKFDNVRFVTPARNEHPSHVAARLARSSRLALDPNYPPESLIVWGEKEKIDEMRSYGDIQHTRSAFQDPTGNLLILTDEILIRFADGSSDDDRERLLAQLDGRIVQRNAEL